MTPNRSVVVCCLLLVSCCLLVVVCWLLVLALLALLLVLLVVLLVLVLEAFLRLACRSFADVASDAVPQKHKVQTCPKLVLSNLHSSDFAII